MIYLFNEIEFVLCKGKNFVIVNNLNISLGKFKMEELKNIVIQTLESNGILGNLRAQLRASVFKVIDSQDKNLKDGCGFQWENPLAPKIIETPEGEM